MISPRSSIHSILNKFEQTIDTNRACGIDRDPFGKKVTHTAVRTSRNVQTRRHSVSAAPTPARIPSFDKLLLRASFVGPVQKSNSAAVPSDPMEKKTAQMARDHENMEIDAPNTLTEVAAVEPRGPQQQQKRQGPPEKDMYDDEEMKALQQQIAALQNRLEKTVDTESRQLKGIEKKKNDRMNAFRTRNRHHSTGGIGHSTACLLKTRELVRYAQGQQDAIQELRQSNKHLRRDVFKLAAKMPVLQEQNAALESELSTTQEYYQELHQFYESEKVVNTRYCNEILPTYRSSIQALAAQVGRRENQIRKEKNTKAMYNLCLKDITAMVKERGKDITKLAVNLACSRLAVAA